MYKYIMKIIGSKKNLFSVKLRFILGDSSKRMTIAPTLSQYGLNLREFNLFFDSKSFFVKNLFEIGCSFNVLQGKILNFKLKEPSSSFFFKNINLLNNKQINDLNKIELLKIIYEVAKVKSNVSHLSYIGLISLCRTQKATLNSFHVKN